jgi:hypothetical protein
LYTALCPLLEASRTGMTDAPSFLFDVLYEDDGFGIDNDAQ